uniref:Uncharacterized protein n=1 Tax=Anolis carolinensis TaxID=28377 RepID=A0A803TEZ9_ANOCA
MATSPQKSPTPKSPPSRKKDNSFLGKLGGTLTREKCSLELSLSLSLSLPLSLFLPNWRHLNCAP